MFCKILVLSLVFLTSDTLAQTLEAILSDTRLPVSLEGLQVVYDGEDSIYVLGGARTASDYRGVILKFNVTAETIEKVGTMDPVAFGSAVWTGNGEILYFGGYNGTDYLANSWSCKPDGGSNCTQIGSLPRSAICTSSVWGQGEYSYIFGGRLSSGKGLDTISRYSSVTNETTVVGALPRTRKFTSAIWDDRTGDAYIFGDGSSCGRLNDIVKFNPEKNTAVKLSVTLPIGTYDSYAIWTGTEAYIIGGTQFNGQAFHMCSFNPSTNKALEVHVNNFPANISGHHCAFVKKLNRIYVFGGYNSGTEGDEILYIDLPANPTNPKTTTTPTT